MGAAAPGEVTSVLSPMIASSSNLLVHVSSDSDIFGRVRLRGGELLTGAAMLGLDPGLIVSDELPCGCEFEAGVGVRRWVSNERKDSVSSGLSWSTTLETSV